jgi:hypothetical protein
LNHKEIIIFIYPQNTKIQQDIEQTDPPISPFSSYFRTTSIRPTLLYQQATQETTEGGNCYQYQKFPTPPAIENIACDNNQQILPLYWFKYKPIKYENDWKKY